MHLLAWNDFHGNLEPARASTSTASSPAAPRGWPRRCRTSRRCTATSRSASSPATTSAPARSSTVCSSASPRRSSPTSCTSTSPRSATTSSTRARPSCCGSRTAAAEPTSGAPPRPTRWPNGGTTNIYPGADFQYLSANVVRNDNGKTLFPAYGTKRIKSDSGKKFEIGIIGEVLEATPTIVTPTGVAGLTFQDEADAANAAVKQLGQEGREHERARDPPGRLPDRAPPTLNGCAGNLAGSDIAEIASRLDPSIKVIVSAHTHAEYRCTITTPDGVTRLITSASSFGRILTDITLTIDDKSGELVAASAENSIVRNSSNPRNAVGRRAAARPAQGPAGGRRRTAVRHRLRAARQPDHRQGQPGHPQRGRTRSARSRRATSSPTRSSSPRSRPTSAAPRSRS